MSILWDIIEVPNDFFNLFKNHRKARFLYYRASKTREKLNISSISKFSQEQSEIVREICEVYPNHSHEIKQIWNLDNCKSVLQYKANHFEEYPKIQEHIPRIIEYGKICHHIYIGRSWHLINFLFSGNNSTKIDDLVIWNQPILGINPILYKKHILESGMPERYYLTINEVRILSELMQDFGEEIISENLKRIRDKYKSLYSVSRFYYKEEGISQAKNYGNGTKDFYCKIADRNNCIIINIC